VDNIDNISDVKHVMRDLWDGGSESDLVKDSYPGAHRSMPRLHSHGSDLEDGNCLTVNMGAYLKHYTASKVSS
jgi:hypothetical protein